MKKILLLCLILITTAGCSNNTLSINYNDKGEVDFCELNDDCDFTKKYESAKVNNLMIDDVNVSIELKKEDNKQLLLIDGKEISNVYKVRKIFTYNKLIMVDAYYSENSCEDEGCRTLLAYKDNGDLVSNLSPRNNGFYYTIGGSELLSIFAEYESGKDYYIDDTNLYVLFTSMDGREYISPQGDRIDICDKDSLKSKGNVSTFIDDEDVERYVQTITTVFKFKLIEDYQFGNPERVFSFLMENAIFKYCIEDKN